MEESLAGSEHGELCSTFADRGALLVDGDLHDRGEFGEDDKAVIEANFEVV